MHVESWISKEKSIERLSGRSSDYRSMSIDRLSFDRAILSSATQLTGKQQKVIFTFDFKPIAYGRFQMIETYLVSLS
jgi:hypothetical protein